MRYIILALAVSVLLPAAAAGQDQAANTGSSAASQKASAKEQAKAEPPAKPLAVRSRANVRVDLTISDQTGSGPVEKKQVTLIAAEESWGKIRTNAATKAQDITAGGPVTPIRLNVDARPFLNSSGAIQLELTIDYNPLGPMSKDTAQLRPTEINQSMTVVLQSGKPMVVSQAADPVTDRKIIVEVVATIVK
jgi:hypothetical protein